MCVRSRQHLKSTGHARTSSLSSSQRSYDALSYPLLNPYGRDGWTPGLLDFKGKEISVLQFYGFHAQVGSIFKPF
jgi:hypothetical protein